MANKKIRIGFQSIGENQPVFFISEIGINHNGDIQIAKKLIDAAFATGWDCVKFQKRTPELCVPDAMKNVERETPWGKITYLEYKKRVEFGWDEYAYIDRYCGEKPIQWTASVWDKPSVDFMAERKPPFIKIPSAKLTESELLIYACKTGIPIFLSTGMSVYEEIDSAVEILEKYTNGDYVLLHTNSTYPTPVNETNIRCIERLKKRYNCIVGYSGHEYDLEPTLLAQYMGAKVVERHITLDHEMWGSDQKASLEVHAMDMLKKRSKDIDKMMGDGGKTLSDGELKKRKELRGY